MNDRTLIKKCPKCNKKKLNRVYHFFSGYDDTCYTQGCGYWKSSYRERR